MADKTLIAGAGKAVKKDKDLVKSLGYTKVADTLFGAVEAIAEEKIRLKREFDSSISSFLKKGHYLDENVLADVMDELEEDRMRYIWGSKKDKMRLKIKIQKKREEYDVLYEGLEEAAVGMEADATAVNDVWESTKQGQSVAGIFNGTNKAVVNSEIPESSSSLDFQELGFNIWDPELNDYKWMKLDEIKGIIKQNSRDAESEAELQNAAAVSMQYAVGKVWTKYNDYQDTRFLNSIKNTVDNGNLFSLTTHKLAGLDGSFYENLVDALQNDTSLYEDFGMNKNQLVTQAGSIPGDPTPGDNKITEDDARFIASLFTQYNPDTETFGGNAIEELKAKHPEYTELIDNFTYNPEEHKQLIASMYMMYARTQWANTLSAEEKWKYDWKYKLYKTDIEIEEEANKRRSKNIQGDALLENGTNVSAEDL